MKEILMLRIRTVIVVLGALIAAALAFPPVASAHTPVASITCTGWSLSATAYEPGQDNTWSVSIDGAAPLSGHFGASFNESGTVTTGPDTHTLVGYVWQNNDPTAQYSHEYDLSVSGCSPASSSVPASSTAASSGVPASSSVPASSTAPASSPARSSASARPSPSFGIPTESPPTYQRTNLPLANTGTPAGGLILLGMILLGLGAGVLVMGRRRSGHRF